jgi:hypothetical protein
MIKIENPNIDTIAKDYFKLVKVRIKQRANYYFNVLNVIFNGANSNILSNDPLNGRSKKSLTNLLLANQKLTDQRSYHHVTQANCYPWVINNQNLLLAISNYLNDEANLKELILCKPDDAINIDNSVKLAVGITAPNFSPEIISFINGIIYYSLFDAYAYNIAYALGVNTCPYCNRNYINTVIDKKKNGVIRPTFDHFFPQSKHPFLALSFYNLIPSCYYCNSSLKSADTMDISTHIHPYKEGFDLDTTFQVLIKNCKPNKSDPENYSIFFKDNMNEMLLTDRYRKIFGGTRSIPNEKEGNLYLFRLAEIYQSHLDIVGEIVVKCDSLSVGYSDSLFKMFNLLNTNKLEFYQYYFGNYFNDKDFNRRPMAKLTKDVVSQVLPSFSK